jgi:FAD/FMN-containing dehydrogenase/Fe-S oxidoreductase
MNAFTIPKDRIGDSRLAERLRRETEGEVRFAPGDRGRYATDASIYQIEPVGVLIPRSMADVTAAMTICREEGIPVLPRGGGTSQCGQTVNRALVLDCTKYLRNMLDVDAGAGTARVEPGITLGALNEALKPHKRFFPVDPSTWARCTIGGMAGNNSCGSKSIRYGLMADNVLAIDALLADGSRFRFGELPDNLGADVPSGIADLIQRLRALGAREAEEIAARFPAQLRRVGGYNLDALTPAARAEGRGNLARLLVGSEGTLAFSAALDLKLWPVKPRKALGICQFPTFRAAMAASQHLVKLDPEAVELVDRTMIDLGRSIPIYRATIDRMVKGEPDSLLIVEFHGGEDTPLEQALDRLEEMMADLGYPGAVVRCVDAAFQAQVAEVREAGLNIMMSMKGDGKPVSFIEDCAVALEDLADYTERLNDVFAKHGTKGTWYAHASVGCLHVRPVLNMKDGEEVRKMRAIAEECFALVREYKGSHSGEHGDGIVRSEFNEPMFGPRIARAFEAVKDAFDKPSEALAGGLLNPGRVVRAPRMDDRSLFRYFPEYTPDASVQPALDWSAWPGPQGGLLGAVEMCNNNGTCRKPDGVMCPSFRATRDEQHLTRGRANTLRLALTGQLGPDALASPEVHDALKLCVSCKGCRRECPTGVDMARMKIEAMAARAKRHGINAKDRLIATMPRWAPLAAMAPFLANARDRVPGLAGLSQRVLGFAAGRSLPRFRRDAFRDAELPAPDGREGEVILYPDLFNRYFEPGNLRAAARVLKAAGYRPAVARPPRGSRPLDEGRTYLAAGLVEEARTEARRTLEALSRFGSPVVGIEPSSLLTLRDEFLSLLPGEESRRLADRALLLSEFLVRERPAALALKPVAPAAHIHGHCHQKSFDAFPAAVAMLTMVPGLKVVPITSSCCGMAGSFGYEAENLEVSKAMAELSLLPAVRAAPHEHLIVADGTSCRHQIGDLSQREAIHSVRVMDMALADAGSASR